MRGKILFVFLLLTVFSGQMAFADIGEEAKGSAKAETDAIMPDEGSADAPEFVSPGTNEVPTDGGFSKGAIGEIIAEVTGGGMGSGLTGQTGMAPMGTGGSGSGSGDGPSTSGPDTNKLPDSPSPVPQPFPNKGKTKTGAAPVVNWNLGK